jgi:hypothetical protein
MPMEVWRNGWAQSPHKRKNSDSYVGTALKPESALRIGAANVNSGERAKTGRATVRGAGNEGKGGD